MSTIKDDRLGRRFARDPSNDASYRIRGPRKGERIRRTSTTATFFDDCRIASWRAPCSRAGQEIILSLVLDGARPPVVYATRSETYRERRRTRSIPRICVRVECARRRCPRGPRVQRNDGQMPSGNSFAADSPPPALSEIAVIAINITTRASSERRRFSIRSPRLSRTPPDRKAPNNYSLVVKSAAYAAVTASRRLSVPCTPTTRFRERDAREMLRCINVCCRVSERSGPASRGDVFSN